MGVPGCDLNNPRPQKSSICRKVGGKEEHLRIEVMVERERRGVESWQRLDDGAGEIEGSTRVDDEVSLALSNIVGDGG